MNKDEISSIKKIKNTENIETLGADAMEDEVEEVLFEKELKITGEAVMEFNIQISTKK